MRKHNGPSGKLLPGGLARDPGRGQVLQRDSGLSRGGTDELGGKRIV